MRMDRLRVLSILGTRPEAIKMAPVIRAMACDERFESKVCVTGQHREMLDGVLRAFDVEPHYDLNVMRHAQTPTYVAAAVLEHLEPVLAKESPEWVLVQGDTTTTMAAALAASYSGCRIGHIEAGLRTGNRYKPFPEEINRRLTSVVAHLHFAPTELAKANLISEGVAWDDIAVTGNTVVDAVIHIANSAGEVDPSPSDPMSGRRLVLVTAHRRENHGQPLESICDALLEIATVLDDIQICFPVHPNPGVRAVVYKRLSGHPHIDLTAPLDYVTLVGMMKRASLLITDSGGLQEEAPTLNLPFLVLRDVTERPEGIAAGAGAMVGTDSRRIVAAAVEILTHRHVAQQMARVPNPYGDGTAAATILDALLSYGDVNSTPERPRRPVL